MLQRGRTPKSAESTPLRWLSTGMSALQRGRTPKSAERGTKAEIVALAASFNGAALRRVRRAPRSRGGKG